MRLANGHVYEGLSWMLTEVGGPSPLWVAPFPGQVVLVSTGKLAGYMPSSEQATSFLHGSASKVLLEFLQ